MMNRTSRSAGIATLALCIGAAGAADQPAIEKAIAAANAAATAAAAADKAAQAAREAAEVARKAAELARAEAIAAGLRDVPVAASATDAGQSGTPVASTATTLPPAGAVTGGGTDTASGETTSAMAYLTANTEGGNATIKFKRTKEMENERSSGSTFSISTPLASGSKSADIATLDGLASGATVGYEWNMFRAASQAISPDLWLVGAQARLSYKRFKFFDSSSLAATSADRYSESLAPFVGYQMDVGNTSLLFLGRFDYQRTYKDADTKVLCPQGTTYPIICIDGPAGGPKLTTKRITSFTVRYKTAPVSGEATLSYDQASNAKGIDLPLYFIQSKEGDRSFIPFNAGVRFGWRSDTRDTSIGVFVGSPFEFFGR